MCQKPILIQPNFNKPFYLQSDASAYSMGAVLLQEGERNTTSLAKCSKPIRHPVAYYSCTFIPAERNYDIYKRELLAVMKSLTHWRHYLGRHAGMLTSKNMTTLYNIYLAKIT
jgi:hypothetical protein